VRVYVRVHVCVCVFVCMYMCMCVFVRVCIYSQQATHTIPVQVPSVSQGRAKLDALALCWSVRFWCATNWVLKLELEPKPKLLLKLIPRVFKFSILPQI